MNLPTEYIIKIPTNVEPKKTIKVNRILKDKTGKQQINFDGMHIIVNFDQVTIFTFNHQLELRTDVQDSLTPIRL